MTLHFGPTASVAAVAFIVLSLGIGSANYAMAAHHVFLDTVSRFRKRYRDAQPSGSLNGQVISAWSLEHITGVIVVTVVMGTALLTYNLGKFNLNQFFGLIGGSLAPIIAGVFPVLIFVASRQRGVCAESRVADILSGKIKLLLAATAFASVYVWQAATDNYALWYRGLSIGLLLSLLWLVCSMYRKGVFRTGGVILIEKGKDGWDPETWKVFEGGREINDRSLMWKTALSGDFCVISSSTSPARILSAIVVEISLYLA